MPALEPCWHCNTPIPSDGKSDPQLHLCPGCLTIARESSINDARGIINALRKGQ
jgi:hypothetical protein